MTVIMIVLLMIMISINQLANCLPEFCTTNHLESAFNSDIKRVANRIENFVKLIGTRYKWLYNSYTETLGRELPLETFDKWSTFQVWPDFPDRSTTSDCDEQCLNVQKLRNIMWELYYNSQTQSYRYQFYRINDSMGNIAKTVINSAEDMPWKMKPNGTDLTGPLWPPGFSRQRYRPVLYLSKRYELLFVVNGADGDDNDNRPVLYTVDLVKGMANWTEALLSANKPLNSKGLVIRGLFLMNSTVYMIGDMNDKPLDRSLSFVYRYDANRSRVVRTALNLRQLFRINDDCMATDYDQNSWMFVFVILLLMIVILVTIPLIGVGLYVSHSLNNSLSIKSNISSSGGQRPSRSPSDDSGLSIKTISSDPAVVITDNSYFGSNGDSDDDYYSKLSHNSSNG